MGGNAFHGALSDSVFPRIPPLAYQALKARLRPLLEDLYLHVAVPREAPEKLDHGDLDFSVAVPKTGDEVPHALVKATICAEHANEMAGNRTSNYAVPIMRGEWESLGYVTEENKAREAAGGDGSIYYQIDVHVCADKSELDRVVYFNSYGDLGMILGLIARNVGLALSSSGLRYPNQPHPPILLTDSFLEIMQFFGWSSDARQVGFQSKQQIFDWLATSRFFNPRQFGYEGSGKSKVKTERKMYWEFVEWCRSQAQTNNSESKDIDRLRAEMVAKTREEALVRFGKKEEVEVFLQAVNTRTRLKEVFNGHNVRKWTDLGEHWKGVKMVMDQVRQDAGGDEGVLKVLEDKGEEALLDLTIKARDALGLVPVVVMKETTGMFRDVAIRGDVMR